MKIQSGSITNYVYFVAVDATDLKTRETGLSSFTVYRSRNGTAAAANDGKWPTGGTAKAVRYRSPHLCGRCRPLRILRSASSAQRRP